MTDQLQVSELAACVERGSTLALPPDYAGPAMTATRALLARGTGDLALLAVPQTGLQADLLIGAGRVRAIESAAVTLGEFGTAPRFAQGVREGAFQLRDSTCPAIHAGLQASEKGIPFMVLRGIIGSDLLAHRPDWRVMNNPFAQTDDPIVALPAIRPDAALFHAPLADREGNVWIGVRRELMLMAHASKQTFVTVEKIVEHNLLRDELRAPGVIPSIYISAIAQAPQGAWPLGVWGEYGPDEAELSHYASAARTQDGFDDYLAALLAGEREAGAAVAEPA